MYPCVEINPYKIKYNTQQLVKLCNENGIEPAGVTKVFCAYTEAACAMVQGGVRILADSRILNLKNLYSLPVKKLLLRIPMHSEAEDVVKFADISLNSELSTLRILGRTAAWHGKTHEVILMVDMGDLREGILPHQVDSFVREAVQLEGISIRGFGTNLTCYGGVIPDENNLGKLVEIATDIGKRYNLKIEYISGGNSSSIYLLPLGQMPKGVNNLRLGESIVLGRETAFGEKIEGLYDDAFLLKAQIVELKEKPSVPIGKIGMDAFGNIPFFEEKGSMIRAIIGIGRQDINPEKLMPLDESIKIIGGSSDHTIADLTCCKKDYKVGDIIEFKLDYGCLLKAMTSIYVEKTIVNGQAYTHEVFGS